MSPRCTLSSAGIWKASSTSSGSSRGTRHLQRAGHGHPVDLHQTVVAEVALEVDVQRAVQFRSGPRLRPKCEHVGLDRRAKGLIRLRSKELPTQPGAGEQPPAGMPQPFVIAQPFHESLGLVHQSLLLWPGPEAGDRWLQDPVAQDRGDPLPRPSLFLCRVRFVATEKLVAPITREHDGHLFPRQLGNQVGRKDGEVPDRIVEERHQVLEQPHDVRPDDLRLSG